QPKDLIKFLVKPDSIDRFQVLPLLQRHHEIETFLDPNTADPENRRHINDADAAHFHVIARQLGRSRHQLATFERSDASDIVGYQAVPALDQTQHAFAFADSTLAADQHSDAKD